MPQMEYTESRWVKGLRMCDTADLEDLVITLRKAIDGDFQKGQTAWEKSLSTTTPRSLNFQLETIQRIIDERNES